MLKCLNVKMNKGFTLIELLVTALIFSIVIGAAMGVFVSAIKLQRYNLVHYQLLNQTSYAVEYMSRMIRMARKDDDGSCIGLGKNFEERLVPGSGGIVGLMFENYDGVCKSFFLKNGQLMDYDEERGGWFGDKILPLTSESLEVTDFNYIISDSDPGQPRVTVFLDIKAKGSGQQPGIKIQTIISQRNLDI